MPLGRYNGLTAAGGAADQRLIARSGLHKEVVAPVAVRCPASAATTLGAMAGLADWRPAVPGANTTGASINGAASMVAVDSCRQW